MDEQHHDALLERASSSDSMTVPRRKNNNVKALKVTGLTVLACLLLAGQAFTAYYVVGQKEHLQALEKGQDTLKKEMTRMLTVAPKMMHTAMSKMPLMVAIDEDSPKQHIPLTRLRSSSFTMQKEGSGLVDGPRAIPKRVMTPMNHMPLLSDFSLDKVEEPKSTEFPAAVVETKCKLQAEKIRPGFFQPQCDEEGNFKPRQCWYSTGYCWCVDINGNEIPGTLNRGPVNCNGTNTDI
ncbi:hypothetical protein QTP70_032073 [Hemibagrus guttatus]|uniref:Thyroglobulin type-1 domain-containing protein n=1 Tax=Hemibagrus guttatus TaxID=175788 RepID=A0AAE0UZZ1_9TELE|nr:hypothetical protein QTP70_032073 [Hemibagrus guttatus]